jgi:hypothetical protein
VALATTRVRQNVGYRTYAQGRGLCSTELFFHPGDHEDGSGAPCTDLARDNNGATFGPAWSRAGNDGCPLDDPDEGGLGPMIDNPGTAGQDESVVGIGAHGFANPLLTNTGAPGTGENHLKVFVR